MNRKKGRSLLLVGAVAVCLFAPAIASAAYDQGGLKVVVRGDRQQIDTTGFPQPMKEAYGILQTYCTECHEQDRIIAALQTGKGRSGKQYGEQSFHDKVTQIMRRPGVGMSRDDARKLTELFSFLVKKSHKL